ncbi:MAG: GIN domain-containing protein [Luteibaculaceae bacterium]
MKAKHIVFNVLAVSMLLVLQSCNQKVYILSNNVENIKNITPAQGEITRFSISVEPFSAITLDNFVNVVLVPGESNQVMVSAPEDVKNYLKFDVKAGVLFLYLDKEEGSLYFKTPWRLFANNKENSIPITIEIPVDQVNKIQVIQASTLNSRETIQVDSLELNILTSTDLDIKLKGNQLKINDNSYSKFTLSGEAKNLHINSNNGLTLKGRNFKAKNIHAHINGQSKITLDTKGSHTEVFMNGPGNFVGVGEPEKLTTNLKRGLRMGKVSIRK